MIVVSHTSTRGATYFCCIFRNSKRFTWTKLFEMCVCIYMLYMLAYHTLYTNRDLLQVKFEKKEYDL